MTRPLTPPSNKRKKSTLLPKILCGTIQKMVFLNNGNNYDDVVSEQRGNESDVSSEQRVFEQDKIPGGICEQRDSYVDNTAIRRDNNVRQL